MFKRIGLLSDAFFYKTCHNEPEQQKTMLIPKNSPCTERDYQPL